MTAALIVALAAILPPAPPAPPAPPVVRTPAAPGVASPEPRIVHFEAGEARCGGARVSPLYVEDAIPGLALYLPLQAMTPIRISFRIDESGRPLSIKASSPGPVATAGSSDVVPAFSAWRFPKEVKEDCRITFNPHSAAIEDAPLPWVYRLMALSPAPQIGNLTRRLWERARPEGGTCYRLPGPRLRAYPPFDRLDAPPGTLAHTFVAFDVDGGGRVHDARVRGSSAHPGLDREAVRAISRSRFASGSAGCLAPFWLRSKTPYAAPDAPPLETFRPLGATCTVEPEGGRKRFVNLPPFRFPEQFERRKIEGWAIISYDVAPWGAIGNAAVVAVEPADAFGQSALAIVRGATAPNGTGATGCVEKVVFRLPGDESTPRLE